MWLELQRNPCQEHAPLWLSKQILIKLFFRQLETENIHADIELDCPVLTAGLTGYMKLTSASVCTCMYEKTYLKCKFAICRSIWQFVLVTQGRRIIKRETEWRKSKKMNTHFFFFLFSHWKGRMWFFWGSTTLALLTELFHVMYQQSHVRLLWPIWIKYQLPPAYVLFNYGASNYSPLCSPSFIVCTLYKKVPKMRVNFPLWTQNTFYRFYIK